MEILYSLLCEGASVGEEDRLDIEGVLHELYAPGFPARQKELALVTTIEWGPGERGRIEFQVELLDPDGDLVGGIHGATTVTEVEGLIGVPARPRTRAVMPLGDVVFPFEGTYRFELVMNGERHHLARLALIDRARMTAFAAKA
ncbi:MAG TPA: hypothetical protein VF771_00290 [Longimicrobiaceae bacterium]